MSLIKNNEKIELMRLVTAGSVDDGKSTMIGRLLYDCHSIFEDQILAVKADSRKRGLKDIDYSLFTDGLSAEREQKITIDVAYRYFSTPKRRFIIADVPGHEQYTRNMVTGAAGCDLALVLIDARKGLLRQSKRHLFIASLLGIPHIAVVVNKMDLVNYRQEIYDAIIKDFNIFIAKMAIGDLEFIPISALKGDMVVERGSNMPWYNGTTLFNYLENLQVASDRDLINFRFPVQSVIRPNQDFRGYAGKIESGVIKTGDQVKILPGNSSARVKKIIVDFKPAAYAFCPQAAVIELDRQLDISRGEMIVRANNIPKLNSHLEVMLCWLDAEPLKARGSYYLKHTTNTTRVFISRIRYRLNINNLHQEKSMTLKLNEIGRVYLETLKPLIFDAYQKNHNTGCIILIDEQTNRTVAAGIIIGEVSQYAALAKAKRADKTINLFTDFSAAGKKYVEQKIKQNLRKSGRTVSNSLVMKIKKEIRQKLNQENIEYLDNLAVLIVKDIDNNK